MNVEKVAEFKQEVESLAKLMNMSVAQVMMNLFPELKELKKTQSGGKHSMFINPAKKTEKYSVRDAAISWVPTWFVGYTKDELANPEYGKQDVVTKKWDELVKNERMAVDKKTGKVTAVVIKPE